MVSGEAIAEKIISGSGGSITDKTVLLNLELRRLGTRRKVSSGQVQTDADRELIHVSKEILESNWLEQLTQFDGETRKWLGARSLPSMFRSGVYMIPIALVGKLDDYMLERISDRQTLVDGFLAEYRDKREKLQVERARLASLFDERDYPAVDKVRDAFGMRFEWVELATPGKLGSISRSVFEREKEKAAERWKDATGEAILVMREGLAKLVSHLVERLKPGQDGKPKVFRDSAISNLTDWLSLFDELNSAVDDRALEAVVERCRAAVNGVDAQSIRDSDTLRERVLAGISQANDLLASLVQTKPARKITFEEYEGL